MREQARTNKSATNNYVVSLSPAKKKTTFFWMEPTILMVLIDSEKVQDIFGRTLVASSPINPRIKVTVITKMGWMSPSHSDQSQINSWRILMKTHSSSIQHWVLFLQLLLHFHIKSAKRLHHETADDTGRSGYFMQELSKYNISFCKIKEVLVLNQYSVELTTLLARWRLIQ